MRDEFTVTVGDGGKWFSPTNGLLAPVRGYSVPEPKELGLDLAKTAAEALHLTGHALHGNVDAWTDVDFVAGFPGLTKSRWIEIANLFRSLGDGLELVVESLCETAGMLGEDESESSRDMLAPAVAAFIIEASIQYLVSTGHSMTNIAFRLCLESPDCRRALEAANSPVRKAVRTALSPESGNAEWLYHSQAKKMADVLAAVSDEPEAECMRIAAVLHETPAFQSVSRARDDYFHRWRDGFRGGDDAAHTSAQDLREAATAGAACAGDAIPAFYHRAIESMPVSTSVGGGPGHPLFGMIWNVDPVTHEQAPLLPDLPFAT